MTSRRWFHSAVAVLVVALVGLRIAHIQHAEFELDELQHLHGAYMVANGAVPFVDFFEHHTPLYYYLMSPLLDPATAGPETILRLRWISLASHLVTVGLGTALAASVGSSAAVAVAALLAVEIFSFAWGTLLFLDSFAVPLLVCSALVLARGRRSLPAIFVTGLLIGTAVLLTQKAVFSAAAPAVAILLDAARTRDPRAPRVLRSLLVLVLGGVIPLLALLPALGVDGALGLWRDVVALNAAWKVRRFPLGEAFIIASYGGAAWTLAGIGLVGLGWRLAQRTPPALPALVPTLYLANQMVGVIIMPTVWYEYFIEIGPFAAIVGGIAAVDLARLLGLLPGAPALLPQWSRSMTLLLSAAVAGATVLGLALRLLNDHYSPILSPFALGGFLLIGAAATLAFLRARTAPDGRAALALLALICALPLVSEVEWLRRFSYRGQAEAIRYVAQHVAPNERVFDGYSGYGLFRPHAYRYWFLHEEMVPMLSPDDLESGIVTALADPRVKVAVRDRYSAVLPPAVQEYLETHFEPGLGPLWVRRE